jgi:intracellular septation protein A
MLVGLMIFLNPITYLVSWIPLFGFFLAYGIGIVIGVFSFLAASILTLFTIALAWLYYRPIAAISLITGITLMIYLILNMQPPKSSEGSLSTVN